MARVYIPTQMRDLTDGCQYVDLDGNRSVRQVIRELDKKFPGIAERVIDGDRLTAGLAVSIDGDVSTLGLLARIGPDSEVHIVAAIGGG